MNELSAEDTKLVTLARATRARTGAAEGAAVRDQDGRTYAAASVALPSLTLSALEVAVAMAVSSGATSLEAGVIVVEQAGADQPAGVSPVRELAGSGVPVYRAGPDGSTMSSVTT